jgi:nitroreductase
MLGKAKIEGLRDPVCIDIATKSFNELKSEMSVNEINWIENILSDKEYEYKHNYVLLNGVIEDVIYKRRSVRKWTDQEVEDDKILEIINSALYAPSSCNTQPLDFIIIKNKDIINKLKNQIFVGRANVCILVLIDMTTHKCSESYFGYLDAGAGIQNMLLTAHYLGLGACWVNTAPHETDTCEIKQMLNIPDKYTLGSIVALGYPSYKPITPARKNYKYRSDYFDNIIEI